MRKTLCLIIPLFVSLLIVSGCGPKKEKASQNQQQGSPQTTIRLGTSPGPYSELFLEGIKPILEEQGYRIKTTEFSELLQADVALAEKSIDVNVDQHTAYLKNFNQNKATQLVGLTTIPTVPAGLFPGRKSTLEELEHGAKIGIPDDPSNAARAYNLLQKAGWIKLQEKINLIEATAHDIIENSKDLDIVEMKSAQIPRSLKDLDYAVIPGSIVYNSTLSPEDSLLVEDILPDYELVVAVDQSNQNKDWAKAIVSAYRSQTFKRYLAKNNMNNYWSVPNEINEKEE